MEQKDLLNYLCKFQINIKQLTQVNIKFPCTIFLQCIDNQQNKTIHESPKVSWQSKDKLILFNESFQYQTLIQQNVSLDKFVDSQITLNVQLISKNKPNSSKALGKYIINLADILNEQKYQCLMGYKLTSCCTRSSISFSIQLLYIHQMQLGPQPSPKIIDKISKLQKKISFGDIDGDMAQSIQLYQNYVEEVKNFKINFNNNKNGSNNKHMINSDDIIKQRVIEENIATSRQNNKKTNSNKSIQYIQEQTVFEYNLLEVNLEIQQNDSQEVKRYKKIINDMKKCNQQQEAYIQQVQLQIDQKQEAMYTYEAQYQNAQQLLADYQQKNEQNMLLKFELSQLKSEMLELEQKLLAREQQSNQLNLKLQKSKIQLQTRQKIGQALITNRQKDFQIIQLNERIIELQTQLKQYSEKYTTAKQQLLQLKTRLDQNDAVFNNQLNILVQQNNQLKQIHQNNQTVIKQYKEIIQNKVDNVNENEQTLKQISILQQQNNKIKVLFSKMQGQYKILQRQRNMINNQLIINETKLSQQQQTIQFLNLSLKEHTVNNQDGQLQMLKFNLDNFVKENQELKKQLERYKSLGKQENNWVNKQLQSILEALQSHLDQRNKGSEVRKISQYLKSNTVNENQKISMLKSKINKVEKQIQLAKTSIMRNKTFEKKNQMLQFFKSSLKELTELSNFANKNY